MIEHVPHFLWSLALTALVAKPLLHSPQRRYALHVYSRIRLSHLAKNAFVMLATFVLFAILYAHLPALRFSWISLLPDLGSASADPSAPPTNVLFAPVSLPYLLGLPFAVLFFLGLPLFARQEERLFREGTRRWRDAIPRSLAFGLAHCLVGVPLAAGLALALPGLWFSRQYLLGERREPPSAFLPGGGLGRATLHHATYNAILVALLISAMLVSASVG